jgi:hypothetical protein
VSDVPELRASDAERERAANALRLHAADGRLDAEELEERLTQAYAARTRGELEALSADLPPLPAARSAPAPGGEVQAGRTFGLAERIGGYAAIMVLLVVIWAATGADYFWPMWPAIGLAWAAFTGGKGHLGHGPRPPRRLDRPDRD